MPSIVARVALALIVSLLVATPAGVAAEVLHRVRVEADAAGRDALSAAGFDIAGHDLESDRVEVITDDHGLAELTAMGLVYEVLETRTSPRPLGAGEQDGPLPDTAYNDPAEVQAILEQTAADHPGITRLVSLGISHQGRDIWGLMISDNADTDEDELAILFNGAHHAREVMTPEVVLDTIEQLTDGYGVDPELTEWVDRYEIWCVPIVNPDGVARVHEVDDYWRKNTRDNNEDGVITSSDGVDLNRNYEWGWGYQCRGSSGSFTSATYRGPSEGSEPEAQAMIELGRRIRPVFDVEYHSYGEDVFYALSCDPDFSPKLSTITAPNQAIGRVIAEEYASRIVQADGGLGYDPAPYGSRVDGTGRDQQYHESGAIAFVTEINSYSEGGFHPDYDTWRQPTVEGHRPGWRYLIGRIGGPAVGGNVVDGVTGAPLGADVALDEMSLPDGKRLTAEAETGRFHLIVVPGAYTLRVEREGYEPAVVPVTVGTQFEPVLVELVPTGAETLVLDDFEDPETAASWMTALPGDTATDGRWIWAEPHGTHDGDVQTTLSFGAPRIDATPGAGRFAFVTGHALSRDFAAADVDGGDTSLVSPPYDLSGRYGVEVSWRRWFRKDDGDPLDQLLAEVSIDDGASWHLLEELLVTTATDDASPAWTRGHARLDDVVAPAAGTRLRFRAVDAPPDHVVEAAIDELRLLGYSIASDGDVAGVRLFDPDATIVEWQPVPGGEGAVYDVVRGDVAALGPGQLGALTCVESNSTDTSTEGSPDAERPATGAAFFYLVRFELGFSTGEWGRASDGTVRTGTGGCS
jgi:hypothetical protein